MRKKLGTSTKVLYSRCRHVQNVHKRSSSLCFGIIIWDNKSNQSCFWVYPPYHTFFVDSLFSSAAPSSKGCVRGWLTVCPDTFRIHERTRERTWEALSSHTPQVSLAFKIFGRVSPGFWHHTCWDGRRETVFHVLP